MSVILHYAHDPMCSWCWAFRPAWLALLEHLPEGIRVQRRLGAWRRTRTPPCRISRCNTACWVYHQYWRVGDKQAGNRE